jgi:hypothetical protein
MPSNLRRGLDRSWVVAIALLAVSALLPVLLVLAFPGVDQDEYVCRVRIEGRLADSLGGRLEFLRVKEVAGRTPAETFVVTIDHGYTAGVPQEVTPADDSVVAAGRTLWLEGTLMDEETYFGEQYLFFGYAQLYVRQVKSGALWPSQVAGLRLLYLSPVTTLASVYLAFVLPFMEEFSLAAWFLILARFVVVLGAVAAVVRWLRGRRRRLPTLLAIADAYLIAACLLAVPAL